MCHCTFVYNFNKCWAIFNFFFTVVFSMKFETKSMSRFSSYLKDIRPTTLHYKTQKTKIGEILLHVTQ